MEPADNASFALHQRAFLLGQLEGIDDHRTDGDLNRKIGRTAERALALTKTLASQLRSELAAEGHLEQDKQGRTVRYRLSAAGKTYLAGLERPKLESPRSPTSRKTTPKVPTPPDESAITDEVREGQKNYLLLQVFDAKDHILSQKEANKIPSDLKKSLGLQATTVANYRRQKLAEQGYIKITPGRSPQYTLLPDGLDYLASGARQMEHAKIPLHGRTLNALIAAARESPFARRDAEASSPSAARLPSMPEIEEAVLAEFEELRREQHSRSGLVPIHQVRQRIATRFGLEAARHDVLDDVILGLWRSQRLGMVGISNLGSATEQQLNDSIQGTGTTLFYLEAFHEQPVMA